MTDFQAEKALVLQFYKELDAATENELHSVLKKYTTDNFFWRGMHPFNKQDSADAVSEIFWKPFRRSFRHLQRRPDIFLAGINQMDGGKTSWVCSMGHLMGLFDEDWLGIPASHKMAFLRYAEFNQVKHGKIVETALFCDILSVMRQVGLNPLPPQTGAFLITPGPMTHDGLLHDVHDPKEGQKTFDLIAQMVEDIYAAARSNATTNTYEELAGSWHKDMIWWGPTGIGASYTIDRYIQQHTGPFRAHLTDRTFHDHIAKISEGNYCGFFGWPNATVTPSGGYLGLPAFNKPADMRVVDIYRRDGDRLAENWVFIDMLHFLNMQGLDVLKRMHEFPRT